MAQITPIIGGLLIPINALSLNHGSGPLLAPSQSEGPGYPSQLISGLPTVFLTPHTGINPSAFAIQNVAQVSPNIILSTSQGISSVEGSSFPVPSNMIITQQKQQSNHPTINLLPEIIKNGEPGGNLNPSMPKNIDNSSKPAGTLMEECQQQNNEELKLTNSPLNSDKMVKQNTAVSTQNLLPMSSISEPCDLPVSNPLCNQGLIQQNVIPISSNIGHGAFPVHSSMVNQGIIQQSLLLRDQLYNNYGRYILPKNPLEYVQCNFMLNNDTSSNNSGGKIQDMNVSSVNAVSQKSNTTGVQGSISNIAESDRCNASQANIKKRISHKNKDIVKVKLDFGLPSSEKKELFLNKHNQQPKSTNSKQNSDSMLNQNVSINIQNTSSMSYVFGKDDLLGSSTSVKKYLIHQTILQDSILNKKKTMLKVRKDLIDLTRNSSDNNSKYPNSVCERTRKVTRQRVRKQITEEKERRNSEVSSRRPTLVFSTLKRKDSSQEQHINHGIQHENLKKAKIDSVISYDIIATRDSDKECKPILTNTSNEIITIDSDSDYDEENIERYIQPEKNSDNTSSVLPSDKTMELIDDMNPSPKSITYNVHQNFKQLIDIMHKDYIDQPLDCLKQETCNMDVDKSQTLMKNNTNVNHTNAPFIKELVKKIKVEPVDEYEPAIKDHIQDIVQKVKVEPVDTYGNEEAVYDIVEKIKIEPVENYASLYTHSGDADSEEDGEYITCDLVDPNKKSITKETIQTPIKTETTECSPINGHMTSVQSTKCSLENVLKSHVYDNENSQGTNKNLTQCSDVDGNENVDHFSESELVIDEHNEEPNIIKSLVQVQKNELNPNQNQGKEKQRRRGRVKYTCITCSEIFHSQADYSRHILNHTGGKLFECDECKKKFNLKYKLASHRDKTHLNATYVCQYCKKEFKYR
ncbi:hypothetical protein C0J52_01690 [Blattella germanica]|nr:hypothetical protein C0J52_01690 [Blattella germanica]